MKESVSFCTYCNEMRFFEVIQEGTKDEMEICVQCGSEKFKILPKHKREYQPKKLNPTKKDDY